MKEWKRKFFKYSVLEVSGSEKDEKEMDENPIGSIGESKTSSDIE